MKNILKVERVRRNMTQQELAEKVGVSRQTILSVETERFIPSTLLALKISHVFGLPVNELFILEEGELPDNKEV